MRKFAVCVLACLSICGQAYSHQTYQLSTDDGTVTYPNGDQSAVKTTDCKANAEKIIAQFQQYLNDSNEPGTLIECELETSTWYFSVFETDYFAGLFTMENGSDRSKVAICYQGAVGYVVVKPVTLMTRHDLIVFMMETCTSG